MTTNGLDRNQEYLFFLDISINHPFYRLHFFDDLEASSLYEARRCWGLSRDASALRCPVAFFVSVGVLRFTLLGVATLRVPR